MGGESVRALLDAARQATGLDDFGDDWFEGPLGAWTEDLRQPNLTEFGRSFLRSLMVRDLSRRLRVLQTLREHPEIADVSIPRIVYITGLERSGTTLLHNLLAQHAGARALLRWELMEPLPPPSIGTYATDPRIARVQASIDKLRGTDLERMHWVNADEPEECVWGFIDAVSLLGQAAAMCMPAWRRVLSEDDLTPAFTSYRRLVQLLLWKNPVPTDGFLVLKAPQLSLQVSAFAAVFPEADFVVTDRDPFRCIVSVAALAYSIIDPFCVANPLADDGARGRQVVSYMRPKLAALAAFTSTEPERVQHVSYPNLVTDPVETTLGVFAALGVPTDDDLTARAESFLAGQRSGARAAPPRELAAMGYDHDEVLADPVVADYCGRFGIEPEGSRLTGAA
jgi:hypothetical protein